MQVISELNQILSGAKSRKFLVDCYYRDDLQQMPLVIFVHGFKGFKDWGAFSHIATKMAEQGIMFVKFNFSHNGTTLEKPSEFADLNAFAENNYGHELFDLQVVIDWILSHDTYKLHLNGKVALLGHSRGGGISILKAAEDPRITKLVTWAAVSDFLYRNKKDTLAIWKQKGVMHATNKRTGQRLPMNYQFIEDLQAHAERYDVGKAMRKLNIPVLIVHGTNDEAVPFKEGQLLKNWAKQGELISLDGAGHTFEMKHPFEGDTVPKNAEIVIFRTIQFLLSE